MYVKDWGKEQPIVFSRGWPLSTDAWEDQMFSLASRGYRCVAPDSAFFYTGGPSGYIDDPEFSRS
jgi:pimeloyl-ACP methyl ester carboxylesterase